MIKSLTVINYQGYSIKLELARPGKTGFIVKRIEGLGPVNANINTTRVATNDGNSYNSAYLDQRDIVLNLQFLESSQETIEDIRHKSYIYFPPKKDVKLIIETDRRTVETTGHVETNEPEIFSNQEGCSITITCHDPYLYSTKSNETLFSGVQSKFTFPFSNPTQEPTLMMGIIKNKSEETVYYNGESEVGMTITIHALGDASNVNIYNLMTRERMHINTTTLKTMTGSEIIDGDTITITSGIGKKSITLLRNGELINILNCLDIGTDWFMLSKGDNLFAYTADSGSTNLQFRIDNRVAYIGV